MLTVTFTGHRPNKIGGYDPNNPKRVAIRKELRNMLLVLLEDDPDITAICGGALGVDTDAARECYKLGIPYMIASPCRNQDKMWPTASKVSYKKMCDLATSVHFVHDGGYNSSCMQDRNRFMVDNADVLISVWDGVESGGTWNCITYANTKPELRHIAINPNELGV